MVEVAEELVEAVRRGQELVAVAEMVLAELAAHVAERLQHLGDGRVFLLQADRRTGQADLGQAGPERALTGDEGGTAGGAALLAVVGRQNRALVGDAVDVGRLEAHHALVPDAEIPQPDIVAEDHEDVRPPTTGGRRCRRGLLGLRRAKTKGPQYGKRRTAQKQPCADRRSASISGLLLTACLPSERCDQDQANRIGDGEAASIVDLPDHIGLHAEMLVDRQRHTQGQPVA